MNKPYISPLILVISLIFATVTTARYIQETDDRDKRQIGDLRTAEYLALITLNKMHRAPSHCRSIACGLVDVIARIEKRTMSDQRIAELQALIALSRGQAIPVGHGHLDPWLIGRRKKRSVDMFDGLDDEQKYRLINLLLSRDQDQLSS